jgi:hypothetical protein
VVGYFYGMKAFGPRVRDPQFLPQSDLDADNALVA